MAARSPFVHLHVLSAYSFPVGACRLESLIERAVELGYFACAITDDRTLYAIIPFYHEARKSGLKPILGCRLPVLDRRPPNRVHRLVALAEDYPGYLNLIKLSSLAHVRSASASEAAVDLETLAAHRRGLIVLSGAEHGPVTRALRARAESSALRWTGALREIFGPDHFFIELQMQGHPDERDLADRLRELARKQRIRTVATHEVRHVRPEDRPLQQVLARLRAGTWDAAVAGGDGWDTARYHLAEPDEVRAAFAQDEASLRQAVELAERCTVELPTRVQWLPPIPGDEEAGEAETFVEAGDREFQRLYRAAHEGFERRAGVLPPEDRERAQQGLDAELQVIRRAGWTPFLLLLADAVAHLQQHSMSVGPGRGGLVGSAVAFALGLTDVNPWRYGLSWSRAHPSVTGSGHAFDLEVTPKGRIEILHHWRRAFGADRIAQVITFHTFSPRAALREAARALQIPASAVERWLKTMPDESQVPLRQWVRSRAAGSRGLDDDPNTRRVWELAQGLEGLPRSIGVHASAVVLMRAPLFEVVPVHPDREGALLTQYDVHALAIAGVPKVDVFASRTLAVIADTLNEIRTYSVDLLDIGDATAAPVLKMIERGETECIPHLDDARVRDGLREFRPDSFDELVAALGCLRIRSDALCREYLDRRVGKRPSSALPPKLETLLADTHGIMLYHDQLVGVVDALAGLGPDFADRWVRATLYRDEAELASLRSIFISACRKRRTPERMASAWFDFLQPFVAHVVPKAPLVGQAQSAHRAAWLKAHYPLEYLCAWLAWEGSTPDRRAQGLDAVRRLGADLLLPDLNLSDVHFRLDGGRIRAGLADIKYVGEDLAIAIIRERGLHGPYAGLEDLYRRLSPDHLSRRTLESLVRAGALDFTGIDRARLLSSIPAMLHRATRDRAEADRAGDLPGLGPVARTAPCEPAASPPPLSEQERAAAERELLGFHVSGRPIKEYHWLCELLGLQTHVDDRELAPGNERRIAGEVARIEAWEPTPVVVLRVGERDLRALLDPAAADARTWMRPGLLLWSRVRREVGEPTGAVHVVEAGPLAEAPARWVRRIVLALPDGTPLDSQLRALRIILLRHRGAIPVAFAPTARAQIEGVAPGLPDGVTLNRLFWREVTELLGTHSVKVELTAESR